MATVHRRLVRSARAGQISLPFQDRPHHDPGGRRVIRMAADDGVLVGLLGAIQVALLHESNSCHDGASRCVVGMAAVHRFLEGSCGFCQSFILFHLRLRSFWPSLRPDEN